MVIERSFSTQGEDGSTLDNTLNPGIDFFCRHGKFWEVLIDHLSRIALRWLHVTLKKSNRVASSWLGLLSTYPKEFISEFLWFSYFCNLFLYICRHSLKPAYHKYRRFSLFQGRMERSLGRKRYVRESPLGQMCESQMKDGNLAQHACQTATINANSFDQYRFTVAFEKVSNRLGFIFFTWSLFYSFTIHTHIVLQGTMTRTYKMSHIERQKRLS